jgi:hypothetical protein
MISVAGADHREPARVQWGIGVAASRVSRTRQPPWLIGAVANFATTRAAASNVPCMRAVQITRFGGPEVMDVVDLPDPVPGDGEVLYEVSSSGVNFADTHHRLS